MEHYHPDEYFADDEQPTEAKGPEDKQNEKAVSQQDKLGPGEVKIFNLRSRNERQKMLQATIPGLQEAKAPWPMGSLKAKNAHRYLFEMMVLDLTPFSEVNKPGFLRYTHHLCPNFQVGIITKSVEGTQASHRH